MKKLVADGPSFRTRRTLGLSHVVQKELTPLLVSASTQCPHVIPKLIRVFSHLTSPIECLIPSTAEFLSNEEGKQIVFEVEALLRDIKVEFTEFKVTEVVVDYLKSVTTKVKRIRTLEGWSHILSVCPG